MAAMMVQSSAPMCLTILALTQMRRATTSVASPTKEPQTARISGPRFSSGVVSAAESAMLTDGSRRTAGESPPSTKTKSQEMDREQPTADHKRPRGRASFLIDPGDGMGPSACLENLDPLGFFPLHVQASQQPEGCPADFAK